MSPFYFLAQDCEEIVEEKHKQTLIPIGSVVTPNTGSLIFGRLLIVRIKHRNQYITLLFRFFYLG